MPESPVSPAALPGQAASSLPPPIRDDDPGSGRVLAVDSSRPRRSIRVDDPGSGRVSAIDSRRPAPRPRPIDDRRSGRAPAIGSRPSGPGPRQPGPGHVSAIDSRTSPPPRPADDPGSGPLRFWPSTRRVPGQVASGTSNSVRPAPLARPSIRLYDTGSGRVRAVNSRRPAARPQPSTRADGPGVSGSCKPSAAAAAAAPNKELEEAEYEIRRLNELCLGEDISYEEYSRYMRQLPAKPDVDTSTKLDAVQLKELNTRHALYRSKYYQLSQQVPEDDKLWYDKFKEDYLPPCLGEGRCLKCYGQEDGKLDWSFDPDYCQLAGLDDYQRLVPRNYGGYEYAGWDEYGKYFHSYEIEQEYIKYCEDLSKKLKWMEAYVPDKYPSLKWGRILTRGTYQAIKIATDFSKITGGLAFSGFYEWLDSMIFDVCHYNEFDGVFYEIWQRYTNETKFRDVLDEVYELNRFPLRKERMRCALENDMFCSDLEEEFLACTTCLKEFAEDRVQITEENARELIAEALRKETQKPKFYEEYCRRKIDIARAIGLISS